MRLLSAPPTITPHAGKPALTNPDRIVKKSSWPFQRVILAGKHMINFSFTRNMPIFLFHVWKLNNRVNILYIYSYFHAACGFLVVPNRHIALNSPFARYYHFVGLFCIKEMLQKFEELAVEISKWSN